MKRTEELVQSMRSVLDKINSKEISAVDGENQIIALRNEKAALERAFAQEQVPETRGVEVSSNSEQLHNAIVEKRAVTLGANGDSGFSKKIFEIAADHAEVLDVVTLENGALPNTKFSLFSPSINNIKRVAEDGTGATASTAAFAPVSVTPAAYLGYVNISDYFIKFAPKELEGKLTDLFGKGFSSAMAKEVVIGDGSDEMLGVYNDTGITTTVDCAATGAPKLKDLAKLVAKLAGKFRRSQLAIVINPTLWADIKNEDTKWTYINNTGDYFTFDSVRVIESDYAPTTLTAGSKVAVVGNFGDYGIAVAAQTEIETLSKTAGSLNTPIQGTMYFDGKVIVPSSFAVLKTV